MIVITKVDRTERYLCAGDSFNLTISDSTKCEIVISESIITDKMIDFIASYRFTLEDGRCPGFHLCGVFANSSELPIELANAILFENLTDEQQSNFRATIGIVI